MRLAFCPSNTAYAGAMGETDAHLILKIETKSPIELGEFVATFVGLGNQYERFNDEEHPDEKGTARFFVKEVRAGSIIAEIIVGSAAASPMLGFGMAGIKHANDLAKFVETYGGRLKKYFKRGGRDDASGKGDVADYLRTVQAVSHDAEGLLSLAVYDDGEKRIAFEFTTREAREAEHNLIEHRTDLDRTSAADHQRVVMTFARTNVAHAKAGKRSGELVEIETIHRRPLPIIYASTLAEERVRHEVADADENVYKKAFDVDVNVVMKGDRPIAYRLVMVHAVFDLPDDE